MHISVGVQIWHTAVANFYSSPIKKFIQFVMVTYILTVLSKKFNKNDFGLYWDDGLAVLKNKS